MSPPIDQSTRPHLNPFPPPLPPRPVSNPTSRRKPVPGISPFEDVQSAPAFPASPPRDPPSLPPRTSQLQPQQPPPLSSQAPPIPPPVTEKSQAIPIKKQKWRPYPRSKRGKRWFWIIAVALLLLVIAIAVIASLLTRDSSSNDDNNPSNSVDSTSSSEDNGGHPLSRSDGGIDIGKPGDIAKYGSGSTDHFIIQVNRSSVVTRLDPIISPGKVSGHVHRFYGGSFVDENLHKASEMANLAQCSTTAVQDDKSLYWVPQVYHRSLNGSLSMVPLRYHSAYYFLKAPTGVPIHPFPDNYNIVAGNPFRREVDKTDRSQEALWWICYRGGGNDLKTAGFPESNCSEGLIAVIVMPSCWDGVEAADGDYTSHVTYPDDAVNGHRCPTSHPLKFMTVQFETNFAVGSFGYNGNGTWALANGDTTGLGIHADFVNGWKPGLQEQIVDKCRYMNKTEEYTAPQDIRNCPPLEPSIDYNAAYNCRFQAQIVDEEVRNVTLLPGCNDIWNGTGSKPPCPDGRTIEEELVKVDPEIWDKNEPYRM